MSDIKQITKNKGNKESPWNIPRGGSKAAATSKMECFVIIVNGVVLVSLMLTLNIFHTLF